MYKITWLLIFITITSYGQIDCSKAKTYGNVHEHSKIILEYYNLAIQTKGEGKERYDELFFCSFPNDFNTMQRIFGYYGEDNSLLYIDGYKIINHFSDLTNISSNDFINKYINICIDGEWEADNIGYAFGFKRHLIADTEDVCKILGLRTDKEIKSILRFAFDGPHPINLKKEYKELYELLTKFDSRIANLLKISYTKLLKDREHHH